MHVSQMATLPLIRPHFLTPASIEIAIVFILGCILLGFLFSLFNAKKVASIELEAAAFESMSGLDVNTLRVVDSLETSLEYDSYETNQTLMKVYTSVADGAKAFLKAEYKSMAWFLAVFSCLIFFLVGSSGHCGSSMLLENGALVRGEGACWRSAAVTVVSFLAGGLTSILSGYIGMRIAVFANARTTCAAQHGWTAAFNTAFQAGAVMGFSLCSLAMLVLYCIIMLVHGAMVEWQDWAVYGSASLMFECVAGYGLGASAVALFGRVGGGIYTKAADVGADLVGKFENGLDEDDPRNPACIADNVGDNVGDVAGMGADLFGSFAEASCAALVIMASSPDLATQWTAMMYPLLLSAGGLLACFLSSFAVTKLYPVRTAAAVERALRRHMVASTLLTSVLLLPLTYAFLPRRFCVSLQPTLALNTTLSWLLQGRVVSQPAWCQQVASNMSAFTCVFAGLWGGLAIGYSTDYVTSNHHRPVKELAKCCQEGAAMNLIFGISLGNFSCILPTAVLAAVISLSFSQAHMFGVALAALGMLSTLSIGLTIDAYGPVCDNAGGIAEMSGFPKFVRERTDVLDAAGNTTAAIGKGFAIGSAALVSLALFGAFVTRVGLNQVNLLEPITFAGVLVGAMLPYWFSAMCMRSVGKAAKAMVKEVRSQFLQNPDILSGLAEPDSERCIRISTEASLREMRGPGMLVIGAPIVLGFLFGVNAVTGLLAGGMVSGVQMAISSSNMGGAWDNAKKYIEAGHFGGKNSDAHKAAVIGDTVGDPLKDTSGPALNILMKLMAIISLVFADFFKTTSLPAVFSSA